MHNVDKKRLQEILNIVAFEFPFPRYECHSWFVPHTNGEGNPNGIKFYIQLDESIAYNRRVSFVRRLALNIMQSGYLKQYPILKNNEIIWLEKERN